MRIRQKVNGTGSLEVFIEDAFRKTSQGQPEMPKMRPEKNRAGYTDGAPDSLSQVWGWNERKIACY